MFSKMFNTANIGKNKLNLPALACMPNGSETIFHKL
jgi:hypothetical protein